MWCWAASAQMILTYLGEPVSQCEQTVGRLPNVDCCDLISSDRTLSKPEKKARRACKRLGGWPDFAAFGFESEVTDSSVALTWEQLKHEIDNERPVAFALRWRGGGGHMMVVTGYSAPNLVHMNDPWPVQGDFNKKAPDFVVMPYDKFISTVKYTHWKDYHQIRRREQETESDVRVTTAAPPANRRASSAAPAEQEAMPTLVDNSPSVGMADQTDGGEPAAQEAIEFVAFDREPEPIGGMKAIQDALQYPRDARMNRIEGRVVVNVQITVEGEVAATRIFDSSGDDRLDKAAQAAVARVKWKPAMQRDKPVQVWIRVPVNFELN